MENLNIIIEILKWIALIVSMYIWLKWLKTWKESLLGTSKIKNTQELIEFLYTYNFEIQSFNSEKKITNENKKENEKYLFEIRWKIFKKIAKLRSIGIEINMDDLLIILAWWILIITGTREINEEKNKKKRLKLEKNLDEKKEIIDDKLRSIEKECKKYLK